MSRSRFMQKPADIVRGDQEHKQGVNGSKTSYNISTSISMSLSISVYIYISTDICEHRVMYALNPYVRSRGLICRAPGGLDPTGGRGGFGCLG